MHVVFRESHGLEETATPVDLGQDPADLVVLSFSDSDLAAFAAGWRRGRASLPSLRLANLVALRHPLSVDTYIERTLSQARGILVRLIGGESYWPYGIAALHQLAKRARHRACGAAGGRPRRCAARCALDLAGLDACGGCRRSATPAARWRRRSAIAQLALASGLYAGPVFGETEIPDMGFYDPAQGVLASLPPSDGRPHALVAFYRSYLTAADTGPVDALIAALRERGFDAYGAFATSLKAPGVAGLAEGASSPNGRRPRSSTRPPSRRSATTARRRSMPRLPGVPGRAVDRAPRGLGGLAARPVAGRSRHACGAAGGRRAAVCRRRQLQVAGRARCRFAVRASGASAPTRSAIDAVGRAGVAPGIGSRPAAPRDKRLAIVLSSYPGRPHQIAHAVGLDALASTEVLLGDLGDSRFRCRRRRRDSGKACCSGRR